MNRYLITDFDLSHTSNDRIEEEMNKLAGMGYRIAFSYGVESRIVFVWEKG